MIYLVRGRGLEPPCLAALAPKASVSAISPPAQIKLEHPVYFLLKKNSTP